MQQKTDLLRFPQRPPAVPGAEEPAQGQLPACKLLMVWHVMSSVGSQPLSRTGAAELPSAHQAAQPLGAAHCGVVAQLVFPEMHPRGEIRSQGKGAGTFLAAHRRCQGSARNWAPQPSPSTTKETRSQTWALLRCPQTPEAAAAASQTFVCKLCGRDTLRWHFPPALFYTIRY